MDFQKVPIGFAMEIAQNEAAMSKYIAMTDAQKKSILTMAHNVRSRLEMHNLVMQIGKGDIR